MYWLYALDTVLDLINHCIPLEVVFEIRTLTGIFVEDNLFPPVKRPFRSVNFFFNGNSRILEAHSHPYLLFRFSRFKSRWRRILRAFLRHRDRALINQRFRSSLSFSPRCTPSFIRAPAPLQFFSFSVNLWAQLSWQNKIVPLDRCMLYRAPFFFKHFKGVAYEKSRMKFTLAYTILVSR